MVQILVVTFASRRNSTASPRALDAVANGCRKDMVVPLFCLGDAPKELEADGG
jgi:hypothetical protein